MAARRLGGGRRAILLAFFPVLLAAPWAFTVRAQVFALPLFTGLIWLLASEARPPSRRVYSYSRCSSSGATSTGSAALAAMLTMLLGGIELVSSRGRYGSPERCPRRPGAARAAGDTVRPDRYGRYYHLLLVDPPFGRELVTEWRRSDPSWDTLVFYVLAALALLAVVKGVAG